MTNESDTDLIARVAEKLGWRQEQCPGRKLWVNPDGNYQALPMHIRRLLRSTDACLALTGEPEGLELWKDGTGWNCSYPTGEKTGTFAHGEPNRPRAILKAILEAK